MDVITPSLITKLVVQKLATIAAKKETTKQARGKYGRLLLGIRAELRSLHEQGVRVEHPVQEAAYPVTGGLWVGPATTVSVFLVHPFNPCW